MALIREYSGRRAMRLAMTALLIANLGTLCAEFAGVAAGAELLTGISRYVSVPIAAVAVSLLVLRGSFHRVEHLLLALSAVFVTYIAAGLLSHPDLAATAHGLLVPEMPLSRVAILTAVATLGTTLAPWGLAFIQSYAVDKGLKPADLGYERIDVITGAILTGVIGLFVVIACAATLHPAGVTINDAGDAALALMPLAGASASTLFAVGFLGAAILAGAIVPLSTAYSVSEALGRRSDVNASFRDERVFYCTFLAMVAVASVVVLIPGIPLIPILFLTQVLNAVLLLAILPFMRSLGRNPAVMGEFAMGRAGALSTGVALVLVAAAILTLVALTIFQ
jgi:Mn2+/Fe2+ NRAMP family transporter